MAIETYLTHSDFSAVAKKISKHVTCECRRRHIRSEVIELRERRENKAIPLLKRFLSLCKEGLVGATLTEERFMTPITEVVPNILRETRFAQPQTTLKTAMASLEFYRYEQGEQSGYRQMVAGAEAQFVESCLKQEVRALRQAQSQRDHELTIGSSMFFAGPAQSIAKTTLMGLGGQL